MPSRRTECHLMLKRAAAAAFAGAASLSGAGPRGTLKKRRRNQAQAYAAEALERRQFFNTLAINEGVHKYAMLTGTTVTMSGKSELHVTGTGNPISGSTINLTSPDAWFWLENIKPSDVNSSYLSQVQVNGAAAVHGTNVRVAQYELGTVVIPHAPSYQPLQAFLGPNFSGASQSFGQYAYFNTETTLGAMKGNLSSFKLKRGYMATIATRPNGSGLSKVYVAQDHDLDVGLLPDDLDNETQFLRVFPWRWVSKKGSSDISPETLNAAWHYNWNNNLDSTLNWEYVPIKQQPYWPATPTNKPNVTHFLGFNEPNNPVEDAYQQLGNGSVDAAISFWPEMLSTGLRVGSPAVTDGGKAWLYEFMDKAIAADLRVDYIAIHNYQAGHTATSLQNWLKDVYDRYHLPIWLTEFNNGANWTGGADPTYEQNAAAIGSFIDMMDNTPWIERYSIYSNVEAVRQMTYADGSLTPAGQVYHDNASPIGYVQEPPPSTNTQGRSIARLPLDGDVLDSSGFGHNGQAVGAPAFVAGQRGQAIQLDGANSYIHLPEKVAQGNEFSFAGWVYWDGGGNWQRIFDFGNGTSSYLFLTPSNGSNMRFAIKNGGAEQIVQTGALPAGQWTHLALTLGGSTARLYVNGALAATNSAVTIRPGDFDPALNYLGKSQYAADPLFKGRLDDVLIRDTVLTQAQIAALMNNTAPQFSSSTISRGPAARGAPLSGSIAGQASDADTGDSVTYSKANGPAWLTVAVDGTLSGTPTFADEGPQEFVVAATDSRGVPSFAVLTIPLAEFYWRGDVNNSWSTNNAGNTNWATDAAGAPDPGTLPGAATDVVFVATGAANIPGTVLGANVSVRSLRVKNQAGVTIGGTNNLTLGSYGLDLMPGAGTVTITTTGQVILGASQVWTAYNDLTVASVISGAAGLTKNGINPLIFLGNNLYTGGTTIAAGTLQLGNGGTTGGIVGNVANNGTLIVNRSNDLTLDGVISGTGYLTKLGGGRLTLANVNTYSDGTTIGSFTGPGVVRATANNAMGTGAAILGPGGNATTARLELANNVTLPNAISLPMRTNASVGVQNISGNNRLSGAITLEAGGSSAIFQSDAGVLTLGAISSAATGSRTPTLTGAGNGVVSGVISNGAGTVALIKSGAGTWTLSGANTYTGATTLNAGTLALGGNERIANTAALALNGGTFAIGGFSETLGALSLSGNSTVNFGSGAGTLSFSGAGTFTSGTTLTVTNWTQGADRLFIGNTASLTAAQLAQINFNGAAAQQLSTGEVVPVVYTAKTYYWKGDLDGSWSTNLLGNTNWSTDAAGTIDPGQLPDANTDVIFAASGATNLANTVLGTDFSIKSLTVTATTPVTIGGTHSLTLGADGIAIASGAGATMINTGGPVVLGAHQSWTNNSANTLTVSSAVSGGGLGLTKAGSGTLVLSGANTYGGGTTIGAGTLQLGSGGTTGSLAGNVVNNAALIFNRSDVSTFGGIISGSGAVTKSSPGTLVLTASNTYSGGTTIGAPGTVAVIRAAANNALGSGEVFIFGNGGSNRLELSGGITLGNAIAQAGRGATVGQTPSILNVSGNNTLAGPVTLVVGGNFSTIQSDGGLLTLFNATSLSAGTTTGTRGVLFTGAGNITVAGAINNGTGAAALQIDKQGMGTLTLAGTNTYTGATTALAGKLVLASSLTTSSALNASGGTIEFAASGGNLVVKTPSISITGGGRIDLKDNKLITSNSAGTATAGVYNGLQGEVQRAYNFGSWDAPGLTTSMQLALDGIGTVGVATGEQIRGLGPTDTDIWAGQTINGASVIAMYTYAGDANLDGQVDAGDYGILDAFIQVEGATGYGNGDFNYDGFIDAGDYGTIDNSIQFQGSQLPTSALDEEKDELLG